MPVDSFLLLMIYKTGIACTYIPCMSERCWLCDARKSWFAVNVAGVIVV